MIVTLMGNDGMQTITLPDEAAGRYWIDGYDRTGNKRHIIMFEPSNGSWIARMASEATLGGTHKRERLEIAVDQHASFPIDVYDKNGKHSTAVLFIEPSSDDRASFRKYMPRTSQDEFTIGRDSKNDLQFDQELVTNSPYHAILRYRNGRWSIKDDNSLNGTFVNEAFLQKGIWRVLQPGDSVFIVGFRIVFGTGFFALNNPDGKVHINPNMFAIYAEQTVEPLPELEEWEMDEGNEERRLFYRSPRFKREVETRTFIIDPPPGKASSGNMSIAQMVGPSLIMGFAALLSGLLMAYSTMQNGGTVISAAPMLIMSLSMIVGMVLWPVFAHKREEKKNFQQETIRQERYLLYLNEIRSSIAEENAYQKQVLLENAISPSQCANRVISRDRSLWDRAIEHSDFLTLRMGLGERPMNCELQFPEKRFSLDDDNLLNAMWGLAEEPTDLHNAPITVSLMDNRVCGLIGKRSNVLSLMRNILVQLTALHSYDELKLVFLINEEESSEWEFARMLPHVWNDDQSVRYYACGLSEAQELSISMERVIAKRADKQRDGNNEILSPHYIVVAADKRISDRCSFVSTLLKGATEYGFSMLVLFDELNHIPKETSIVVEVSDEGPRLFDKNDTSGKELAFKPDEAISADELLQIAFELCNTVLDLADQRYELPSVLTFMEMYKAGMLDHLDILTRWRESDPTVSLAAPIGVDENGDVFNLDLHEKMHGPHGLVAGMTGSGKSEFIITYILSMAINYSPEEVAFVLIDYKGGGLALAFDNEKARLPHLAGTITNLDGASIHRSLVSIEAELKRRQHLFNQARELANEATMDIYKYQLLHRLRVVEEPLPHLFVISDEFAELKMQQPEFMEQLVSTARIGRSLGVHLILATQKPSGIVNDQIWSNARFKVCLKVQDRSDSMDMIKRPEAAELVDTGRFYLQIGFNEFFALGQSAWSGAPYEPTEIIREKKDDVIAVIDNLGHVIRETKASRRRRLEEGKQIVRIVDYICEKAISTGLKANPLWLDPIPERVFINELKAKYDWRPGEGGTIEAIIGEYDDPSNQRQGLVTLKLPNQGNSVVYGAAGSGKAMLLSALVFSLISNYSPKDVSLYLVDFATEQLDAFFGAPHVGDVILAEDEEKLNNLFTMLENELAKRKKQFADYGGDITAYIRSAGERIPHIVVIIDGVVALSEISENAHEKLKRLSVSCSKYGIYFVVTSNSTSGMGFQLSQNFKTQIALRMNDQSEYSAIMGVGRAALLSSYIGAGIIKIDEVLQFQTAHPINSAGSIPETIRQWIQNSFKNYSGVRADRVPVLPDVVNPEILSHFEIVEGYIPFGLAVNTLLPEGIDFTYKPVVLVSGESEESLLKLAYGVADYLAKIREHFVILDPTEVLDVANLPSTASIYSGIDNVCPYVTELQAEEKSELTCIFISPSLLINSMEGDKRREFESYFANLNQKNSRFILIEKDANLEPCRFDTWLCNHITGDGVWVGSGINDQSIIKLSLFSTELMKPLKPGFGYVVQQGVPVYCKIIERGDDNGEK